MRRQSASAQGVFTLSSTSFKDGERLATKNGRQQQVQPELRRRECFARAVLEQSARGHQELCDHGVRSVEGRPPGGVSHWVAYGIPAAVTGFAEGEVSKQTDKFVGGQSLMKLPHYFGPCTPPGPPHHYIFTLMATDLEPAALKEGMTREELIKALDGHAKSAPAWSAFSRSSDALTGGISVSSRRKPGPIAAA